jgi:FkbM family methyltransferase
LIRFFRKLCASTLKRYFIAVNNGYSIGKSYGLYFLFDWRHSIDKKVAFRLYEDKQLMLFKRTVVQFKPDYFFDIGAHAGLYSLLAKSVNDKINIHAFEPDKQNLSQLYANLYLNKQFDNINVHSLAISNSTGQAFLDRSSDTSRATRCIADNGSYQVDVSRFDDLFPEKGKSAIFKIDVEGHESGVIEGAEEFLKQNQCILIIESRPAEFVRLQEQMKQLGYHQQHFPDSKLDHFFLNLDFSFHD